ncbi:MAG TPA: ATP-binding protein [Solirubrobacterales bacterium]|nr:ATP-binding protein [Solirubrobacterales bacterium]
MSPPYPGGAPRPRPAFIYGNIVFGTDVGDAWGLYRLAAQSYAGLSVGRKLEVMAQTEALVHGLGTDFQVLRVARRFSTAAYLASARQTFDRRHGGAEEIGRRREAFEAHLRSHVQALADRETVRPDIFLAVRLQEGAGVLAGLLGSGGLGLAWRRLAGAVGIEDPRGLRQARLAELERFERRTHERILGCVEAQRALASEAVWLVRHAYVRGLGEPVSDANFRPQALAIVGEGGEEVGFEPAEWDLLRLHSDYRVRIAARHLEIESEQGVSLQAMLVCGSLPEVRDFPGPEAELMFAPLDLEFPVDACLHCEVLPNRDAQKLARRRMVDADQMWREETAGDHGPSPDAEERPAEARELQRRLGGNDHPPLLRTTLSYVVSAAGEEEELEERIEQLRAEVGPRIHLHRPLGAQHQVFLATLPAQRFPLAAYREHLLPEEVAAMVPTAVSHAGSEMGPYIGYTLTGSRQPIRLDLAEASQQNRPPPILFTGSQGSGKTVAMELLTYQAFLQGSGPIVVIDPKGTPEHPDHRLHLIPEMAAEMEQIVLSPEERYRGLLDPLRIAPPERRADAAFGFVMEILPEPIPAPWQTEIRAAIEAVCAEEGPRHVLGEVARILEAGGEAAREAGRALSVHGGAGLAKLAFGLPGREVAEVGTRRVISVHIRNLTLARPGTPRAEMTVEERVGSALLRLVAMYALNLCGRDPDRHSVIALDEAWVLFDSAVGLSLLDGAARKSRSQNLSLLLSTQQVVDAEEVEGLIGAYFSGGVETDEEAARSARQQRLDEDDPALIRRFQALGEGRFYYRDIDGQSVLLQIDPCEPRLFSLFGTPPPRSAASPPGEEAEAADVAA